MRDSLKVQRLPVDETGDSRLQRMVAYWLSKCGAGRLPARADIDPVEFPWALGDVCLLDVERQPLRFRYRLDGSNVARRHKVDLTGRTTDEVRPRFYAEMLRRHFQEVVETGQPSAYRIMIAYGNEAKTYRRLALPLAADGRQVDRILTYSRREPETPRIGRSGAELVR